MMNDARLRNVKRSRWDLVVVPLWMSGLVLGAYSTAAADEAQNVALIGYHDMQGRQALQVTTKSDSENGNWVYVGHVPNTRTRDATLNPITGRNEWNGTSVAPGRCARTKRVTGDRFPGSAGWTDQDVASCHPCRHQ